MINDIKRKYDELRAQVAFAEAQDLLKYISDDELLDILEDNKDLFIELSDMGTPKGEYLDSIEEAVEIFGTYIQNRGLTKDEYDSMTIDDRKDYLWNILDETDIYKLIKKLEDDSRNKKN